LYLQSLGLAALCLWSAAPALAQVAILQIRVIEGEGAVHVPGTRSSRPITVEITDETGRPVAGAAVSFHLPEEGPGGAFVNGLRTEVVITDANGRASLHGLQANRVPGRFQIRILASKEQARAGTVSFQYVAESRGGAAKPAAPAAAGPATAAPATPTANRPDSAAVTAASSGRKKWILVAAAVAGAAVAGTIAARAGASSASSPAAVPSVPVTPVLGIGSPTITVGKP
jgi:hypothetical protein